MRRVLPICVGLLGAAAIAAPAASAAPASIIGGVPPDQNLFTAPSYDHEAGTIASIIWQAGGAHDADATGNGPDGEALFRSELTRSAAPVSGTQYVPQGVYPFVCTVHNGMVSSLNVNSGTPLPRPQVKLKVRSTSLAQVLKTAAIKVKTTVTGGQGEAARVNVKLGKRTIGIARKAFSTQVLKIALTSKGRATLAKRSQAKVKAEATIDFGAPAGAKRKLR